MQAAPQLGTTGGKRVKGEYMLAEEDQEDLLSERAFEDTIAIFPNVETVKSALEHSVLNIPTALWRPVTSMVCWSRAERSPPPTASTVSGISSRTACVSAKRQAPPRP